ncbi:hypothetical protein CRG98_011601 [Punica granatum]|uniref:Retrovirus-related Pol polyprotein from transposon TNT 1-94-like beta-barrel domain-containing protein n=1 Tax=Punica granatum TaxID=22663 RepID=A0A2I0KHL4_PUNGR|nr:hypothetical protein CRG98_011601 [Punica granatum]
MLALLVHNGLKKVLSGTKPESMSASEWEEMSEKVLSAIQLCLTNDVLKENKKKTDHDNEKGKQKTDVADVVVAKEKYEDVLLVIEDKKSKFRDEWILYSRCSYHICLDRDYFFRYKSFEGGVILMGNNTAYKTIGIGTVGIRMHDDSVVRTLKDIRIVPDLKKNIISLGILDSNGYNIIIESNDMKISCGALVLMKGIKIGSLYILHGSIATGSAAISSSRSESDSTELWHMLLRHMSEKLEEYLLARDRESRQINPPQRYDFKYMVAYALSVAESIDSSDSTSYSEAIHAPDSGKWLTAMEEEMESLHKNGTWEQVKSPTSKRIVGCK